MNSRWLLALAALPMLAQDPALFRTWSLVEGRAVEPAIEQATASMSFLTRPIARGRLKKLNPAYAQITLGQTDSHWTLQFEQRTPLQLPRSGQTLAWTREDGERFNVTARVQQGLLEQHYQGQDGARTNRFRFDPATRTLTLEVVVTSNKLPQPVTYTLRYR